MVLRTRGRQSGVTLVEMLIALALLGFILLGIAPLFLASVKSNYSAQEYTSVNNLGRDKLEELMNQPIESAELAEGAHTNDLPATIDPLTGFPPSVGTPSIVNPYERSWNVTHFQIPPEGAVGVTTPFAAVTATASGPYDYKRVDVLVLTDEGHLGIGRRRSMVSGYIENPRPGMTPLPSFTAVPPTATAVPPTPTP